MIKGEAVGRTIGFPTANLALSKKPKIKHGVYAALVTLKRQNYLGLAYFGPRYIFEQKNDNFEVYIFNFNKEIYREKIRVKLLKFLRKPKPVKNLTRLKKLLETDVAKLKDFVVLVNRNDKILGIEPVNAAHRGKAKLHRAVSVLLFNRRGEFLLQKRGKSKKLWPLYWSNTVCTHPHPGETYLNAAKRRLREEFGLTAKLTQYQRFIYRAEWKRGGEYELDQVFIGLSRRRPRPNPKEIAAWKYVSLSRAKREAENYTPWCRLILKKIKPSDIVIS